jgi:hypothetical protein
MIDEMLDAFVGDIAVLAPDKAYARVRIDNEVHDRVPVETIDEDEAESGEAEFSATRPA